MSSQERYYMPKHLDEPMKLFLLPLDEFLALAIPFVLIGFFCRNMVLGLLLGAILFWLIRIVKKDQGQHYLVNLVYWYLPEVIRFRATPPSHIRHYLG